MQITFEKLPEAVTQILDKVDKIESLLLSRTPELQPEPDRLLTIKETAELLHLTVPTIYGLVQRREIPVCKRGKRLYFSRQELLSWIMEGRKKTSAEIESQTDSFLSSTGKGSRRR